MLIRCLCLAILCISLDAFRIGVQRIAAGQYSQCIWRGPDGGSKFEVAFPRKNCALMCKGSLHEVEIKIMPYFLARTKFSRSRHSCYCYKLQEMIPVFAFTAREEDCTPAQCWAKLKWMLNFEVPGVSHVAHNNIENFKTSCEPCASLETCPEKLTLPDFLSGGASRSQDEFEEVGQARNKVEETLGAEGITLNPVIDDEVKSSDVVQSWQAQFIHANQIHGDGAKKDNAKVWVRAPSISLPDEEHGDIEVSTEIQVVKDEKAVFEDHPVPSPWKNHPLASALRKVNSSGPFGALLRRDDRSIRASCDALFPLPCKVQAGPDGDEWLETAHNCVGNELIIQIHPDHPESLIAIRVDSVDHVARYGTHEGENYGFIDVPASHSMHSQIGEDTWAFAPHLNIKGKVPVGLSNATFFVSFWHSKAAVKLTIIGKDGQSVKLAPLQELQLYFIDNTPHVSFIAAPAPTIRRKPADSFMGQLRQLLMIHDDVEVVQHPFVEGVLPVLPMECVQ